MQHETVLVYRHMPWTKRGYDPTNGGISGRRDRIEVFSPESTDEEIRTWCERNNEPFEDAMRLNKRELWGEKHYYIEPVVRPEGMCGPIAGGNYAATSDGGWARMLGEQIGLPVPIHDRFDTWGNYEILSR